MLIMIIIVLLFPVLNVIVPENEAIAFINSKLDGGRGSNCIFCDCSVFGSGSAEGGNCPNSMELRFL